MAISMIFRAQAQLAVTEVMSGETDKNHPDWWELHNYGTNDIDLTGYSWNDDSHGGFSGADTASFSGFTIHSNETIIVTEQKGVVTDAGSFRTWWGLGSSVQVVVLNSADPGLGASPIVSGTKRTDSVRLWRTNLAALGVNTNGLDLDECSDYLVQRVDLGVTVSQSVVYDPTNDVHDILSTSNASATVATDIGTPGIAPSPVPAAVVQKPANQNVIIGSTVSFTNGGVGLPPFVYHWFSNNIPITSQTPGVAIHHITPGLTDTLTNNISVLTLVNVQTNMNGTYKVIADNGLQSFTNSATLAVNATATAPTLNSVPPANLEAYIPQTVPLAVAASGFPTPTYQWYSNNVAIVGETGNVLSLSLSDTNQSATYSVIVTNSAGGTNKSVALNVTPFPKLVITEVMSSEGTNTNNGDPSSHADWFELSNLGDFPVNLHGYRIDDSHNAIAQSAAVTNYTFIHPGESVVFVQDMTAQAFRTWWGANLPSNVQIITYNGSGQGLSGSGDEVHVWNAAATDNADQVTAVGFSTGTVGDSFGFDPTHLNQSGFDGFTLSTAGVNGAFVATVGGDIGSPGAIVNVPLLTTATFTNGGFNLSWVSQPNWNYTIQYKTNLTDLDWSTLTTIMSGNTNLMNYTDSTTDTQRFYRVKVNLQNP